VTSREFRERLARRARRVDVAIEPRSGDLLECYFSLLARWNTKINLTALPLRTPTDETFDRLLIEPLAAARHIADEAVDWVDLGSGGGSPAIPIKIVRPRLRLTMVESKARKAAFLREAIRMLPLVDAAGDNVRFEELVGSAARPRSAQLVTVRAVRADPGLFGSAAQLLAPGGRLLLFRPTDAPVQASGFRQRSTVPLINEPPSYLTALDRVFHVEQRR
jgi:16S rRNA (guanine527-N7)-methyltransferase